MNDELRFLAVVLGALAVGVAGCGALGLAISTGQISVPEAVVCGGVVLCCWACLLSAIMGLLEV